MSYWEETYFWWQKNELVHTVRKELRFTYVWSWNVCDLTCHYSWHWPSTSKGVLRNWQCIFYYKG
jgi:hypothetical protein